MNKKYIIIGVVVLLIAIAGFFLLRGGKKKVEDKLPEPVVSKTIPKLEEDDLTVEFELVSEAKGKSVVLGISNFPDGVESFSYELTYDAIDKDGNEVSQGVIGSPVMLDELDGEFTKKIFLGSCSRKVCVSHEGMTEIKVLIRLDYEDGEVKVWEKDFPVEE